MTTAPLTPRSFPEVSRNRKIARLVRSFPALVPALAPRLAVGAGRCVAMAFLACLLTRPMFHRERPVPSPRPTAAPVSVTEDISRRLSVISLTPGERENDGGLWAGVE